MGILYGAVMYSAALCRGLIEAAWLESSPGRELPAYSAALCRGLIEADPNAGATSKVTMRIPRLYAAASLKLETVSLGGSVSDSRIPRLYAAASLKPIKSIIGFSPLFVYSAALCRGLIEAARAHESDR